MSPSQKPLVFIISAPSGSGKSTLTNELLKLVPNLEFSISYTTRALRGSEQNGKHYHFISLEEFNRMIAAGEFLEYARVHGNCYGTAREFLRQAGRKGHDLLLDIDVLDRLLEEVLFRRHNSFRISMISALFREWSVNFLSHSASLQMFESQAFILPA